MIYAMALFGLTLARDEAALRSAIQMAQSRQPANLQAVDDAVLDYAQVLQQQGRFRDAEPLFLRSRELNLLLFGAKSREVAMSLLRLGAIYHAEFQFGQAETITREALDLLQTFAGEESLEYACALANLAANLAAEGENARAEPVLRRAISLVRKHVPHNGPMVAGLETNLGLIYLRQGEAHQARPLLESALAVYTAGDNPLRANALAALGELDLADGRWREAETRISDAYSLAVTQEGEGGPSLAGILRLRALLHEHFTDFASACENLRRSIKIMEALAGRDSPALLPFLDDYARLLRKSKRGRDAQAFQRRARAIRKGSKIVAIRTDNKPTL